MIPASYFCASERRKRNERKKRTGEKAGNTDQVKLTKNMAIADMIKALEPEIARALPSVITPERFTRRQLCSIYHCICGNRALLESLNPPQSGSTSSFRKRSTRLMPFPSFTLDKAFSTVYTALKYVKSSSLDWFVFL